MFLAQQNLTCSEKTLDSPPLLDSIRDINSQEVEQPNNWSTNLSILRNLPRSPVRLELGQARFPFKSALVLFLDLQIIVDFAYAVHLLR